MKKITNPLDHVKVASPCKANWDEMRGSDRQRYCAMCKLNVYNLSEMTRDEAESFLINAEGRTCVKFYRRADGTVLTKDCPVGWQAVRKRVSRSAKAFLSLCAGIFGGVFAFNQFQPNRNFRGENSVKVSAIDSNITPNKVEDFEKFSTFPPLEDSASKNISSEDSGSVVGQLVLIPTEKSNKNLNKKRR